MGALLKIGKGILGLGRGKTNANYANQGFNYLQENPLVQAAQDTGAQAVNTQAAALGLGGSEAQQGAFNNFLDSLGYKSELDYGRRAIEGSAAARGKLNSGSTLKSLTRYGQDLAQRVDDHAAAPDERFVGGHVDGGGVGLGVVARLAISSVPISISGLSISGLSVSGLSISGFSVSGLPIT